MNVLAEEQSRAFDLSVNEEERRKRQEAFYELYYRLRSKDENSALGRLSLEKRQKLHWIALSICRIKNHLSGFTHSMLHDRRMPTERAVIYTVTHVGKFDIEIVSEAIKDHYYLLSGDYEHMQGTVNVPFLALNGVFYFNENVKDDRAAVTQKMIAHLSAGGNLMYFPEGVWNLSPNLPVLPCYWGIVEIAQRSNAIIVPIAVEQYGKHFKINIGRNFDMSAFGVENSEKSRAISELRDVLATLKWEIWESEPRAIRSEMLNEEWERYIEKRLEEWPNFSLDHIDRMIYKPKNIVAAEEVFAHLNRLSPCRENAFLFRLI